MKFFFLLLAIFPLTSFAEDPVQAQSPRDASPAELVELTNKISKSLLTCAYARRNKDAAVNISNRTEDYIDKDPIQTALLKNLKLKIGGNKIALKIEIASAKSVTASEFESTYTMTAHYLQNGKKFCEKTESFTKKGH